MTHTIFRLPVLYRREIRSPPPRKYRAVLVGSSAIPKDLAQSQRECDIRAYL
ncbi:hypothetical protein BDW22DRAFT_875431 [Trametopsis cervina]|nr:hypothetical protein BDW22DRAFT_875431 [Trametopsis cervina]